MQSLYNNWHWPLKVYQELKMTNTKVKVIDLLRKNEEHYVLIAFQLKQYMRNMTLRYGY